MVHTGHPLVSDLPRKLLDPEWMPRVADRGLVVIGRDRHLHTRPGERELFAAHQLRVLRIGGSKDLSTWDQLARLVTHWDTIEAVLRDRPTGPWLYEILTTRLRDVPVTGSARPRGHHAAPSHTPSCSQADG